MPSTVLHAGIEGKKKDVIRSPLLPAFHLLVAMSPADTPCWRGLFFCFTCNLRGASNRF